MVVCGVGVGSVAIPCFLYTFPVGVILVVDGCAVVCGVGVGVGSVEIPCILCMFPVGVTVVVSSWDALGGCVRVIGPSHFVRAFLNLEGGFVFVGSDLWGGHGVMFLLVLFECGAFLV